MSYWNKKPISLLLAFFLLFGINALQAQMKTIQVEFKILEENYNLAYEDVAAVEQAAAEMLIEVLSEKFPFVQFGLESAPMRIIGAIDLEKNNLDNPFLQEIDLILCTSNQSNQESEKITTTFKSADDFDEGPPATSEAFLGELQSVLVNWLDSEQEKIVKEVMSNVSLAEKAHPDAENDSWILPFSEDGFMIGEDSEFIVTSKFNTGDIIKTIKFKTVAAGKVLETSRAYPEEYRGKILASIKDLEDSDKERMGASNLSIEGIYMTKFIRAILANPFSPEEFNLIEN